MKYHKIKNVDKQICTAEQKIAYNLAFAAHISYQELFNNAIKKSNVCATDLTNQICNDALKHYRLAYDYKPGKYDEDAIYSCLKAGLFNYLKKPFIAADFKKIGECFPAYYLTV